VKYFLKEAKCTTSLHLAKGQDSGWQVIPVIFCDYSGIDKESGK